MGRPVRQQRSARTLLVEAGALLCRRVADHRDRQRTADQQSAQAFLDRLSGNREIIETEPGVFRRAEITGDGYKVFTLTALMSKAGFDVHIAKMTYVDAPGQRPRTYGLIR